MKWFEIKKLARELRKNQTVEESILWKSLRNRKMNGIKFFRQHPLKYDQNGRQCFFIADFYSNEISLVIEIDGEYHTYQKNYDKQRENIIKALGLEVVRFSNEEIKNDLNLVLKKILEFN